MGKLFIINFIIIAIIVAICILIKKQNLDEKKKYIILLVASLLTIICHYSLLFYNIFSGGDCIKYLKDNPNLLLPIYPCNIVMWCCLIFGLKKNKTSKFATFLIDYIFYFGLFSALIGMFANVEFIENPTLTDYVSTKSILAHGFMLFNIALLLTFGYIKIDLPKNMHHILASIIMMLVFGIYCNGLFTIIASKDSAYIVNSMFLMHSPFEGLDFLTFPIISIFAFVLYFILFNIIEIIKYGKENIWYKRYRKI